LGVNNLKKIVPCFSSRKMTSLSVNGTVSEFDAKVLSLFLLKAFELFESIEISRRAC